MIDRDEVIRMAKLARLELSPEEIELYQRDLNNFLVSGRKLQQVDVGELEGTSHATAVVPELRPDLVEASLTQEDVLASGPQVLNGFFKVPRILEEQE